MRTLMTRDDSIKSQNFRPRSQRESKGNAHESTFQYWPRKEQQRNCEWAQLIQVYRDPNQ